MPQQPCHITLTSPDATARMAAALAPLLRGGDVLLLAGGIGAGKTHFARALIQSLLPVPEDVPSPTFTLVQVYDTPEFEIWHSDLYRLSHPDEVVELGLPDAFESALCLVEWPDRLGDLAPLSALSLDFALDAAEETRQLTMNWTAPEWDSRLEGILDVVA
ncbi:tRNA (adenosine(37)-N6)-threonylcarbamoyltransferase complex ATPase subunit type 1 TsaE [Aquicoccus porphyridii]|uniref:tRNA (adenosine(37)-N6)-threonylcarbamoyltransferase complex ATPase subunit type 1 TsaE n=1 Tax=Aquicoccus porphyridii TaxID=1852029 RepID=UPI00273F657C|nr:tRNA (adenosine(37)-N6)-threonylcarbamoyltransferase complex ATPase subunit type 1 TsaE [Aquicoccus porphyridii]